MYTITNEQTEKTIKIDDLEAVLIHLALIEAGKWNRENGFPESTETYHKLYVKLCKLEPKK